MPDVNALLSELNSLILADPEKARKVFAEHPELAAPIFNHLKKEELAKLVKSEDSPRSFLAYCELLDGAPIAPHLQKQAVKVYEDHAKGTGSVLLAFRGSRKTTTWGVKFISYRVGKEPHKTNIAIGAVDDSPEKVCKSIAAIIEFHPEWKRCFPNVVPDPDRGWSVEGYYVKDVGTADKPISKEDWTKKQASTIDPSFVGGGYQSKRINGKHPTGVLYIDDVHDINNNSEKQRKEVVRALTTVILKTVIRINDKLSTWVLGIGVPWATDDGYQTMVNAGYGLMLTPAMVRANEGDPNAVYIDGFNPTLNVTYEDIKGWWILTWPENFGINAILQERSFGKAEFWQMIMLDIATASTGRLIYHEFPARDIKPDWPRLGGCDPISFDDTMKDTKTSFFALGVGVKRPIGGLIVETGVLEQCTLTAGENYIFSMQNKYINWLYTAVENVGVGKVFIQSLRRNPYIRIIASGLKGISDARLRSKRDRFLNDVAPLLESGDLLISDEDNPYLNALRRGFTHFFDLDPEHSKEFDAMDSLWHIVKSAPDAVRKHIDSDTDRKQRQRSTNPLAGIGVWHGY